MQLFFVNVKRMYTKNKINDNKNDSIFLFHTKISVRLEFMEISHKILLGS